MKRSLFDYIITFVIALVIFAIVAVFLVNFAQGLMNDVVDKVNNGEAEKQTDTSEYQWDEEGVDEDGNVTVLKTFLFLGLDESGKNIDTMFLIGVNSEKKQMTAMLLPSNTYSLINNVRYKIGELYSSKGIAYIKSFVRTEIGINPSYYFIFTPEKFGTLVDFMDGIEYDVKTAIHYEDRNKGKKININAGKQKLDGDQVAALLSYQGYPKGLTAREDVQIDFVKAFCEFFFQPKKYSKVYDSYYNIMDGVDTDFKPMDFVNMGSILFNYPDYKKNAEFLRAPGNSVSSGHYAIAASKATAKFNVYK